MKLMTRGNTKLPTSTLNFSLPPVLTCPGATAECIKHCYARKAYIQYPNVRNKWDYNYRLIDSNVFEFMADIKKQIKNSITVKQIRVHTSGDFHDQRYVNAWFSIANQFKNKIFYAYTKSFHLNFSKRPTNFILIKSDDKSNGNVDKRFDGVSRVFQKDEKIPKKWFICPGDCKLCLKCYTKENKFKRIAFKIH